jgi:carbon-monoxide dehydrogenase medium subunit
LKDFQYVTPKTLREALSCLSSHGEKSRILAGGTDLLVQMRSKRHQPEYVIDVKQIPELSELSFGNRKGLVIGASVPCFRLYSDANVAERYPGIVDSASIIGGIQIQGRATLGGNLCNSSPSADSTPALIAYSAVCNIVGPNGKRVVSVEEFCLSPGKNALQSGEILVSIQIPPNKKNQGGHYQRFIPRNEMDIAVVGVGSWVELANRGKEFKKVRIALGAVGPTPIFAEKSSDILIGKAVNDEAAISTVALTAREEASPISDMRGPAEFRTHLVGVLVKRTLTGAVDRAKGKFVANAVQEETA